MNVGVNGKLTWMLARIGVGIVGCLTRNLQYHCHEIGSWAKMNCNRIDPTNVTDLKKHVRGKAMIG